MNKIILILAATAVFIAPLATNAGTTLYGNAKVSLNSVDSDTVAGQDGLSGDDNVSLFGVKGSYGDDVKSFFHIQTGAPTDGNGGQAFNQRFFYAGLSGGFGKVAYGRLTNAYKMPGFKLDPFYNLSHIGAGGTFSTGGATYGLSGLTNGFTDNSLEYTSPMIGNNIKLNVGLYIDDTNADEHGNVFGVTYSADNIMAGVRVASNGTTPTLAGFTVADGDATRIFGSYDGGMWSAAISLETVDLSATTDADYMYLTGDYEISGDTKVVGSISTVDGGPAKGDGTMIGLFHNAAENTQVYVTFGNASIDAVAPAVDPSFLSIGAIHKFSLGAM